MYNLYMITYGYDIMLSLSRKDERGYCSIGKGAYYVFNFVPTMREDVLLDSLCYITE